MSAQRSWRLPAIVAALALLAWLALPRLQAPPATGSGAPVLAPASAGTASPASRPGGDALPGFLPPEVAAVIANIRRGPPFPHRQDGSVFGNREGRLPAQPRGWYREYTVPTPGLGHRGLRRIVTGGNPPREWYYTADHYESFRAFTPPEDLQ